MSAALSRMIEDETLRDVAKRSHGGQTINIGWDYTSEELEFARALHHYKRAFHRPFPTCREVLAVLRWLGYIRNHFDEDLQCSSTMPRSCG